MFFYEKNQKHVVEKFSNFFPNWIATESLNLKRSQENLASQDNHITGLGLPGARLPQAAGLHHGGRRADAGGGAARCAEVALVQQLQQLLLRRAPCIWGEHPGPWPRALCAPCPAPPPKPTPVFSLVDHVHGCGQVPHLDAAVRVAREQVAPGPRAHPAGALALPHRERGDGGAVHRLDLADSARGSHSRKQGSE